MHDRQKLSTIFKNNLLMLRKIAKFTPSYFVWTIIEGVLWGICNTASTYFTYFLLNALDSGVAFSHIVKLFIIMALYYIFMFLFDKWYWNYKYALLRQKYQIRMHEELFRKAREIDLACFDDPEFYNNFVWAMNESDGRAMAILEDTSKLINRLVSTVSIFGLLLTIDPFVAVLLFLTPVISAITNLIVNKISFQHSKASNPLYRKKDYINRVFHLADYAKELRLSQAGTLLMREYDETMQEITETDKKYGKKYFLYHGLVDTATNWITFSGALLYMIFQLQAGAIAVGGFAASVSVVWNIGWTLTDLIDRISRYPEHSLFIDLYLQFLRIEPQIKSGTLAVPAFESLEFRDVSFSYDFSSHPKSKGRETNEVGSDCKVQQALKHVNLKICKNEKVAIVGYNGAGKTTLIKLILRLYDPTEGVILYNGIDIKNLTLEAYRRQIGTVFQDFKIFAASLAENVMNGIYDESKDRESVLKALDAVDFNERLKTLEHGLDTHLTREFSEQGTNLSGGEAQKVAIARTFSKPYPIMILDEPSSALDPMAEYALNQSILRNTAEKTVIFISHRLSTTRIADKIFMFDAGRLIEQGSHAFLLAKNGKYAEMFRLQSEKYQQDYANAKVADTPATDCQ